MTRALAITCLARIFDRIEWSMPAEYSSADRIALVEWLLHPIDDDGNPTPAYIDEATARRLLDAKEQS